MSEEILNILRSFRRGLHEIAAKLLCKGKPFFMGNLALSRLVTFVADKKEDGISSLDAGHGLSKDLDAFKRHARGDGVNEDKALSLPNPLITKGSIFLLTSGVNDFNQAHAVVYEKLLSIGIFDCRIISLYETVESELHGERGFANAAVAKEGDSPGVHECDYRS